MTSLRGRWRWILLAGMGLLWWWRGALLLEQPDHELAYAYRTPVGGCTRAGCVHRYVLAIGNTGSEPLAEVRIRLHAAPLSLAVGPPSLTNFGVSRRPFTQSEEDGIRTLVLHGLLPDARVELTLALRADSPTAVIPWAELLVDVQPSLGRPVRWEPALLRLGRIATLFSSVL